MPEEKLEMWLEQSKEIRLEISNILAYLDLYKKTRSSSISYTKLEEAKMWLGKHMWEVGWEDLNAKRDAETK